MYAGDQRWGGFNPCKFMDRVKNDGSYWVLPSDLGNQEDCQGAHLPIFTNIDEGKVQTYNNLLWAGKPIVDWILAYDGFCANGVRDKKGPHFTTSLNPRAKLTTYAGGVRVIELNHYLKAFETTDDDDEKAAVHFYKTSLAPFMPRTDIDVRAENVPLFGHEQIDFIPARKVVKP